MGQCATWGLRSPEGLSSTRHHRKRSLMEWCQPVQMGVWESLLLEHVWWHKLFSPIEHQPAYLLWEMLLNLGQAAWWDAVTHHGDSPWCCPHCTVRLGDTRLTRPGWKILDDIFSPLTFDPGKRALGAAIGWRVSLCTDVLQQLHPQL